MFKAIKKLFSSKIDVSEIFNQNDLQAYKDQVLNENISDKEKSAKVFEAYHTMLENRDPYKNVFLDFKLSEINNSMIENLTSIGGNINVQDVHGTTLLMRVAQNGTFGQLITLLDYGADAHLSNEKGQNAFMLSIKAGNDEVTNALFNTALMDHRDMYGRTPLFYAAERGDETLVKQMFIADADLNHQDAVGNTPLIQAVRYNHIDMCKKLIQLGADIDIKNNDGKTALDVAIDKTFDIIQQQILTVALNTKRQNFATAGQQFLANQVNNGINDVKLDNQGLKDMILAHQKAQYQMEHK